MAAGCPWCAQQSELISNDTRQLGTALFVGWHRCVHAQRPAGLQHSEHLLTDAARWGNNPRRSSLMADSFLYGDAYILRAVCRGGSQYRDVVGRSRGIAAEIGFFRDGEGDARHGDVATVDNTKRSRKRSRSLRQKGIYKTNKDLRSSAASVPEAKNERADGPSHVTSGSDVEPNIFTSTYFRDIPVEN